MNLLEPDLLAEIHIALSHDMHGNLTVSKLHRVGPLTLTDTVGQIAQTAIRMLCQWAGTTYGVTIQGWIGAPAPQRPELRALLDAARALSTQRATATRLQVLRDAVTRYEQISGAS